MFSCLLAYQGYRHWHADVRPDDTPLEAGLGFTCKLKTATPFLGREAVEAQKAEGGVKKKLVTFTLDAPVPLWGLEGLWRDGQPMGYIRRAEYGHYLKKGIGYGYVTPPEGQKVNKAFLGSGHWEVESMGRRLDVTPHSAHPFDPKNLRVRGLYDLLQE